MNEIEKMEKYALIEAFEQLRQENGFYLYKPSNNQPERLSEKTVNDGSDSLTSMET